MKAISVCFMGMCGEISMVLTWYAACHAEYNRNKWKAEDSHRQKLITTKVPLVFISVFECECDAIRIKWVCEADEQLSVQQKIQYETDLNLKWTTDMTNRMMQISHANLMEVRRLRICSPVGILIISTWQKMLTTKNVRVGVKRKTKGALSYFCRSYRRLART